VAISVLIRGYNAEEEEEEKSHGYLGFGTRANIQDAR
jgi:hypothetical protein